MCYSLLENGALIPGRLEIGSLWQTQWGPRRVLEHTWRPPATPPDMPHGC